MLIASINNVTKFFFYEEGYIRTSSLQYNLEDLDDVFVHLTNDAVQQNHEKYSYYEKGNKLSYHEFQKYLDFNYAQ
jgi:tubulin polyglutamylase TTLL1